MSNQKEVLNALIIEANNVDNSESVRKVCRDCADRIEAVITRGVRPRYIPVPLTRYYEARCGACSAPLQTDTKVCEVCGSRIEWH